LAPLDATDQPPIPVNNISECPRQICRLRLKGSNGGEACLMDSVRHKWANPSAVRYCEDLGSKKYVDFINSKMELPNR